MIGRSVNWSHPGAGAEERARLCTAGKGKAPPHPLIIDARLRLGSRAIMLGLGTSGWALPAVVVPRGPAVS